MPYRAKIREWQRKARSYWTHEREQVCLQIDKFLDGGIKGRTREQALDVVRGLVNDRNLFVRNEAVTVLGMWGTGKDAPLARSLFEDSYWVARCSAVYAFGILGGKNTGARLCGHYFHERNTTVRGWIAMGIIDSGFVPHRAWIEQTWLRERSRKCRWHLAILFCLSGDDDPLIGLLESPDKDDQFSCYSAFGSLTQIYEQIVPDEQLQKGGAVRLSWCQPSSEGSQKTDTRDSKRDKVVLMKNPL